MMKKSKPWPPKGYDWNQPFGNARVDILIEPGSYRIVLMGVDELNYNHFKRAIYDTDDVRSYPVLDWPERETASITLRGNINDYCDMVLGANSVIEKWCDVP